MTERPILFSGPMVRAILSGQKTVTRRAVKGNQIPKEDPAAADPALRWNAVGQNHPRWGFCVPGATEEECASALGTMGVCPYGRPGDRLWVREAHSIHATHGQRRTDGERWGPWGGLPTTISPDRKQIAYFREGFDRCDPGRWRPSIHMPRWASRILLEVTAVRVERLQNITEEQARREGLARVSKDGSLFKHGIPERDGLPGTADDAWPWQEWEVDSRKAFEKLWVSINGAESWDANPWVWAVEFKQVTP